MDVDTIQGQLVAVDIQSHRGIDALHHRHGAGVSVLNAAETQSSLSAPLQGAYDLARKGSEDFGAQLSVIAEQGPQAPGKRAE
jgi:hypothetical protein